MLSGADLAAAEYDRRRRCRTFRASLGFKPVDDGDFVELFTIIVRRAHGVHLRIRESRVRTGADAVLAAAEILHLGVGASRERRERKYCGDARELAPAPESAALIRNEAARLGRAHGGYVPGAVGV
jgi:hypothetical protein